jgi:hypothetical protein
MSLDAMLIWDVTSYPGVVVACRAIGVLHVEQNRTNHDPSVRIRNDRIITHVSATRFKEPIVDPGCRRGRLVRDLGAGLGMSVAGDLERQRGAAVDPALADP